VTDCGCGDACTPRKGAKARMETCPGCGDARVLFPGETCIDCYRPSEPEPGPPVDTRPMGVRVLEVLRMYAERGAWGRVNASRPASYFRGTDGAGYGPAERVLEALSDGGYIEGDERT